MKEIILKSDIIVCQLEIPMETVEYISQICKKNNKVFILNPAPAEKLSQELIENSTYITPNELEILEITEEKDIERILYKNPKKIILTNGKKGVKYCMENNIVDIPAIDVEVADTTGAGDTFNGAFAYAIANEMNFEDAIKFANIAAGISVTKKGAQNGMPNLEQIQKKLINNNIWR